MLCTNCRSFTRGRYPKVDLQVSLSWDHLLQSARQCECCDILVRGCQGLLGALRRSQAEVKSCDIWLAYEPRNGTNERDCQKLITLHFANSSLRVEFTALQDEEGNTDVPSPWDDMPSGRRVGNSTASDEAFQCITKWIGACSTQHEFCGGLRDRPLPTRLVDVGFNGGPLRVVETDGETGQYVALSHCWGKAQIITTTKGTLARRKAHIKFEECSETFYQAIQLTKRMGISYIWIDSLCIVQDDKEDWAREASKMAAFYQNAAVTIAATSSDSGNGGLYRTHPDFVLLGATSKGEPYRLLFRECIVHETMDAQQAELSKLFPLLTRAWVLQERILSPRVVHFGPYELFFECKTTSECECGEIEGFEIPIPMPKLTFEEAQGSHNPWYIARAWRALIGLYTGLSLSYTTDILPALGGLARQMSNVRSGTYVAGLWTDSMIDDLLWMGSPTEDRPAWRAPYWSWASVIAPVYYRDGPLFWNPEESEEGRPPFEHMAEVLDCGAVSKFGDGFGEVESGVLRIQCHWAKATLHYWGRGDAGIKLAVESIVKDPPIIYAVQFSQSYACQIVPDYALDKPSRDTVPSGTEVVCVPMSIQSVNSTMQSPRVLYMLVLLRADSEDESYERIALVVVDERRGLDIDSALEHCSKDMRDFTLI